MFLPLDKKEKKKNLRLNFGHPIFHGLSFTPLFRNSKGKNCDEKPTPSQPSYIETVNVYYIILWALGPITFLV